MPVPDVAFDVRGGDNDKILVKNFGGKNFAPLCSSPQKVEKFGLYDWKRLVPIGAAGEKFLKFNTFSCIFKTKNDIYVFL